MFSPIAQYDDTVYLAMKDCSAEAEKLMAFKYTVCAVSSCTGAPPHMVGTWPNRHHTAVSNRPGNSAQMRQASESAF